MKKYIPLVVVCILLIALTWSVQEGLETKKMKGKVPTRDLSYTYMIRSDDDWTLNEKTIEGIITDTRMERCIIMYPIGTTNADKFFVFMDEKAFSEDPRVRLLILYNKDTTALDSFLQMLDIDASDKWRQSLFVFAKDADKPTKQIRDITVL